MTLSYNFRVFMQDFAPAGATRGLCGRPFDPFACPFGCYWLVMFIFLFWQAKSTQTITTFDKNQETWEGTEGFQRAIADFVCSHCPLVAAAAAKPLFCFRGMFRLRAGYFPEKESSQSSPGLRARTQESCAVSLAFPAGAVASRRVSNHYRCRSAQ